MSALVVLLVGVGSLPIETIPASKINTLIAATVAPITGRLKCQSSQRGSQAAPVYWKQAEMEIMAAPRAPNQSTQVGSGPSVRGTTSSFPLKCRPASVQRAISQTAS